MNLHTFKTESFYNALQLFFEKLNIPVNYTYSFEGRKSPAFEKLPPGV